MKSAKLSSISGKVCTLLWRRRMETRLRIRPLSSAILCAALTMGSAAYAQNTSTNAPPKAPAAVSTGGEDEFPDIVEIDPFGGISTYGQVNRCLTTHLVTGGVAG